MTALAHPTGGNRAGGLRRMIHPPRRTCRPTGRCRRRGRRVDVMDPTLLDILSASSGWAVLAMVLLTLFRMIARGRLITPREADAMQRRIDRQDEAIATKDATIARFTEGLELNNDLVKAFLSAARAAQRQGPE